MNQALAHGNSLPSHPMCESGQGDAYKHEISSRTGRDQWHTRVASQLAERHEPLGECLQRAESATSRRGDGSPGTCSDSAAPAPQRRMTHSMVKMSRAAGATRGTAGWAPSGQWHGAANEVGSRNQPDCGDMEGQLAGRSRVIHMLWNGFASVGVEPADRPWLRWLMMWSASRTWPACAWPLWVSWVHAAGSGSALAESCGRREDPAIKAVNRLSAATTATMDCHRRVSRALSRPTVAALYKTRLER